jgi:uncharacterized protein YybS (DUF2232 family)
MIIIEIILIIIFSIINYNIGNKIHKVFSIITKNLFKTKEKDNSKIFFLLLFSLSFLLFELLILELSSINIQ